MPCWLLPRKKPQVAIAVCAGPLQWKTKTEKSAITPGPLAPARGLSGRAAAGIEAAFRKLSRNSS